MQDGANTLRSLTLFVSSHFMFNVLGKLQSEILDGDKKQAVHTLSDYSKLLRQACDLASKPTISIKEEGLFLQRYLNLETQRFAETPFDFEITGFDSDAIQMQPFLLQPLAELAVLGGLGPAHSKVSISFDSLKSTVSITSDMRNREIPEKLFTKLEVVQNRLKIFNHQYEISETDTRYLQKVSLSL
jgi:LytS/YehU family sensor histidine kinase